MADTAEQTRVALPWQQGDARGTLNLPAATKVEDLKLCLNASDCAAVMFDAVIIEVRKGSSVLKRKLDTQEQDAVAIWPFLSSWSGSFILWFNIGFEIPRRTDPHLYSITAGGHGHSMGCAVGGGACGGAFNCAGPPLGNRCCACAQSGDLALEGCISSLTGSLPLGHEGRGQASPVVHSWQPRSKARGPG